MFGRKVKFALIVLISLFIIYTINTFHVGNLFIRFLALLLWLIIFFNKQPYENKIAWLMIVALEPIIGITFYLTFGRSYKEVTSYRKKKKTDLQFNQYERFSPMLDSELSKLSDQEKYLLRILYTIGEAPVYNHTNIDILSDGKTKLEYLLECIEKAERFIHLEYYIVRDDIIGTKLKNALIKKAREGVEVRFLWDDAGSMDLPNQFAKDLKAAGVKIGVFGKVFIPFVDDTLNFRNHRKIAIIDNKIGFTGGMNIGDEYMTTTKKYGDWRDTHILVEGDALRSLHLIFAKDWYHVTKENFIKDHPNYYLSTIPYLDEREGFVQIISSGPDVEDSKINDIYFKLFTSAKKEILIATPYLIPTKEMLMALITAAYTGVKVKVLVPGIPDKIFVYQATQSYYEELLEAGVEIYESNDSFMHSKYIIIDDVIASVGTANLDVRSLIINFETTAILFKANSIIDLKNDYLNDISLAKKVDLEEVKKRSLLKRTFERFAQLFSPLL